MNIPDLPRTRFARSSFKINAPPEKFEADNKIATL
jgi:hypothetical protein